MGFIGIKFKLIYHQKELITVLVSCYTGIQEILWKIMVEYGRYQQNISVMKWDFTTKSEEWGFDQWIMEIEVEWDGEKNPLIPFGDFWPLGLWQVFPESPVHHNVSYGIKIMEFYHQTLRTMWCSPEKLRIEQMNNGFWRMSRKGIRQKKSLKVELMSHWIWDFQTTPNRVAQTWHVWQ